MSYFECFSVTGSTIYCFNPKLRLCFVRNWVLLYIKESANRCAQLSRSSYYSHRFTFFVFSLQNKQIVKVLGNINSPNVAQREDSKVSRFLKIMKLVEHRIAKKCHDFHHCRRWLHHHYSRGCHVQFYLMKQSLTLTT